MGRAASILLLALLGVFGCRKPGSETDIPPVNTPQPNPIVEKTNQVGVPLTNVPVTTSRTNR